MKRYRPHAVPRRAAQRPDPRSLFRQPDAGFYRLPELEIRGGYILTDGCRRVLDFAPERLCLDMGRFVITLYGAGLRIESFAGRRLSVAGQVTRIDFTRKWGAEHGET
ncbi:MAG TPA: sporulation protein [Candidatus Gemmiger faecigallinarum]|nr:sporulation protein [Candidatus Gemmiger faecigallinarum]